MKPICRQARRMGAYILVCFREPGHDGDHFDEQYGVHWSGDYLE
jgi:hypothetical protein